MKPITLLLLGFSISCFGSPTITNSFESDFIGNKPVVLSFWRGDTRAITASTGITNLPATAQFLWQTNGMALSWWTNAATVSSVGDVSTTWTPGMDSGSDYYTFFFRAGGIYCPRGTIRMQGSPGNVPNAIPLPVPTIDFGTVTALNPPWATMSAVSNYVGSIEIGGGGIANEVDPIALPFASNALAVAQAAQSAADSKVPLIGTTGVAVGFRGESFTWQGVGIPTNYIVKVEYDGTNINFNIYEVAR